MNEKILIEENKKLKQQIEKQKEKIHELKEQVALLELLHFGPKSEKRTKHDEQQARLFNEAEDAAFKQDDPDAREVAIETI